MSTTPHTTAQTEQQGSGLVPTYTCRHCRRTFTLPGPPIVGQARGAAVAQMLADHMGQEHQNKMANLFLTANQLTGLLIFEQFEHQDAEITRAQNDYRLQIRRITKRVHITDERIAQQVDDHIFKPNEAFLHGETAIRSAIILVLKTMRDALDEVESPVSRETQAHPPKA